jgi:formylglycine-generating enzyme required for sulfatase activity
MGADAGISDELPMHMVDTWPSEGIIEITKSEISVSQYEDCVMNGGCTEPSMVFECAPDVYGNWGTPGRERHPVNCVSWYQAKYFCENWLPGEGRLATEAEWEYAARSGGQDIVYPWGNEPATCEFAVMNNGEDGCGASITWEMCSKPKGNTDQGLCDMAGNVWEWVQDTYHGSYDCDANPNAENCGDGGVAPSDGSAWEDNGSKRCMRGGSFHDGTNYQRAANRGSADPNHYYYWIGFRCIREVNVIFP